MDFVLLKQAINELLDRRIEETTAGLRPCYAKVLRIITEENATIIADYISAARIEVNLHLMRTLIRRVYSKRKRREKIKMNHIYLNLISKVFQRKCGTTSFLS